MPNIRTWLCQTRHCQTSVSSTANFPYVVPPKWTQYVALQDFLTRHCQFGDCHNTVRGTAKFDHVKLPNEALLNSSLPKNTVRGSPSLVALPTFRTWNCQTRNCQTSLGLLYVALPNLVQPNYNAWLYQVSARVIAKFGNA
jgi:hypothetical protein